MADKFKNLSWPALYYLVDPAVLKKETVYQAAQEAIKAGVKIIQYRDKPASDKAFKQNARQLRRLTSRHGVIFIINDRVNLAKTVGADGVHLGQDDLPVKQARKIIGSKKVIGLSTHSLGQLKKAQNTSADYLGFGPLFETPAKPGARSLGLKKLAAAVKNSKKPLVAIGGIDRKNIAGIVKTRAPMIAVRGVFRKHSTLSSALAKLKKTLA